MQIIIILRNLILTRGRKDTLRLQLHQDRNTNSAIRQVMLHGNIGYGADTYTPVFNSRTIGQSPHTVIKIEYIGHSNTDGFFNAFSPAPIQGEHCASICRLIIDETVRSFKSNAASHQRSQGCHIHLHAIAAHLDPQAGYIPETAVLSYQLIMGLLYEDIHFHKCLVSRQVVAQHLTYLNLPIINWCANGQRTQF